MKTVVLNKDNNINNALIARLKRFASEIICIDALSEADAPTLARSDIVIDLLNSPSSAAFINANRINNKVIFADAAQIERLQDSKNHLYLLQELLSEDPDHKLLQLFKDVKRAFIHPVLMDPASLANLDYARKVAHTNATVLLTGETGTGKEMLAHYIHHHSNFRHGPFVAVNCAALPENMLEAIMFGYEKGAFTNAIAQHIGKFEQANGGTLLLDEISEMPLGLQAKLLRVLQEREIERVGGKTNIPVHVRIIAASNTDLNARIQQGEFRKDLFYRLNVVQVNCLALKDRKLDILPLANWFLEKYAHENGRQIPVLTEKAQQKLLTHAWPGNIRELENVIQRSFIHTEDTLIRSEDLHFDTQETIYNYCPVKNTFKSKLVENEAKTIIEALHEHQGSRQRTAKYLNMSPRTLRYKIAKLKLIGVEIP